MVAEVINPYTYQILKSLTHSAVWTLKPKLEAKVASKL